MARVWCPKTARGALAGKVVVIDTPERGGRDGVHTGPGYQLSVSEIVSDREFRELQGEWNQLLTADPLATIFQSWEFQYFGWKMVADGVSPCVLLVRDHSGTLVGCAPLGTLVRRLGPFNLRILQFVCSRWARFDGPVPVPDGPATADYSDVLAREGMSAEVLATLAEWLRQNGPRWDLIRFGPLREDSTLFVNSKGFSAGVGLPCRLTTAHTALFIQFNSGWRTYQDVLTGLGKKWAKKRRQEVRKLMQGRGASFETVTREPDLALALTVLIDLHQKRQRGKQQLGHFRSERVDEACRALIGTLAAQGRAAVHVLSVDGQPLAALATFDFRGTRSLWILGTDASLEKISPGHVLHALCIDDALSRGLTEFDFLIGREEYKTRWASHERLLQTLEFRTGSWRHVPYLWSEGIRARMIRSDRLRALYLGLSDKGKGFFVA